MNPNPATDDLAIFEEYVKLVREKYAMLDFKGVDIEQLSDSLRQTINGDISDAELFEKLATITRRLRDGHSALSDGNGGEEFFAGYDFIEGYPAGIDVEILVNQYIGMEINPEMEYLFTEDESDIRAIYGTLLQNREIGYIWIPSWNNEISSEEIETIFAAVKDTKGLIFDQRQNTGGDPSLATTFASYLTDTPVDTGFERFKTGPNPNDFTDSPVILQPTDSENRYTKPVAILIDRFVYSAGTTFSYSVDPIPTVTFYGQRSGGGSGSVADGYLANGWKWDLSISEFIDAQGRNLDDGIDPDVLVALDINNKTQDEVIERALLDLQ